MSDSALIDKLGGPARVADLIGLTSKGRAQRVHNWRTRGIPAAVRLQHLDVFGLPNATPTPPADKPAEMAAQPSVP